MTTMKGSRSRVLALVCIITLIWQATLTAQPSWLYKLPKPGNKTYLYVVESASGRTELDARNQAIIRVFQSNIMRLGYRISSSEITEAVQEGRSFEDIAIMHRIPVNKVCEYTERVAHGYRVYLLCQVARGADIRPVWNDFSKCLKIKKNRVVPNESSVDIVESGNYVILPFHKLMVQTTDLGEFEWRDAKSACRSSTCGNYTDWRLPKKKELMALFMNRGTIKLGNRNHSSWGEEYWSSSRCRGQKVYYLRMSFDGAFAIRKGGKYEKFKVRAVRSIR